MSLETILIIVGAVVGGLVGMYLLGLYLMWTFSALIKWVREEWDKGAKKDGGEGA